MPQPGLTANERRFSAVCRLLAAVYLLAFLALLVFRRKLGVDAGFAIVSLALTTGVATACLVAAGGPRERRHSALPALVAPLAAALVGAGLLLFGSRAPGAVAALAGGLPLFLVAALAYRAAAPGVRSAAAAEAPAPAVEEAPRIQLKVSKS